MNKITTIIVAVVLIGISFYGGIKYDQSKTPARGNFLAFANGGQRGTRGGGGANGGGFVNGDIIAKDATSVTVKMRDGGSKIIFVSPETMVMKTVSGKLSDLLIGEQITGMGTANPDGSITASSVQIRPATTTSTTN